MNDQPERREGIKALLRQIHRQARMSDVTDWRHLQRHLARGLPDLLVIDWQPSMMSVDALRAIRAAHAALAVAVLTDVGDASTVGPLVRAGALGVIPRDLEPRLILRALELVLLGGHYVPVGALGPDMAPGPAIQAGVPIGRPLSRSERAEQAAVLAGCRAGVRRAARAALLSPRQQQIMRLVHLGNTNKTIARVLDISEGTVKIHLAAVFRLLGAANRAAAVALYNGWQYGELQSLTVDSGVSPARGADAALAPGALRLAAASAQYGSTRSVPARPATVGSDPTDPGSTPYELTESRPAVRGESRAERTPPYLIAAQPEWPFAPPRKRTNSVNQGGSDRMPVVRSQEFEAREGATRRTCAVAVATNATRHGPGSSSKPRSHIKAGADHTDATLPDAQGSSATHDDSAGVAKDEEPASVPANTDRPAAASASAEGDDPT
ncbi:DNA-binding response regulator [Pararobbsia alpina]